SNALHGHFSSWERMLDGLPEITPTEIDLKNGVIAQHTPTLSAGEQLGLSNVLKNLMPWRKGPFSLYGVNIDTEWRSDWKWDRVLPHLSPLKGRLVL
ncbi:DUF1698 domain-containing protein, partial [Proteus terrae]|uniref:DUF1698 domain-containing protein n=1 Tax=Proteus terrae TaxID=1574161 RepID=UPI00301C05E9